MTLSVDNSSWHTILPSGNNSWYFDNYDPIMGKMVILVFNLREINYNMVKL